MMVSDPPVRENSPSPLPLQRDVYLAQNVSLIGSNPGGAGTHRQFAASITLTPVKTLTPIASTTQIKGRAALWWAGGGTTPEAAAEVARCDTVWTIQTCLGPTS